MNSSAVNFAKMEGGFSIFEEEQKKKNVPTSKNSPLL
jgi:hypothetical protein